MKDWKKHVLWDCSEINSDTQFYRQLIKTTYEEEEDITAMIVKMFQNGDKMNIKWLGEFLKAWASEESQEN